MTTPSRELGPARFQRRAVQKERHVLRALGAGIALVALLAGLPAALLWLDGAPPVPTALPTRDDLVAEIGAEQLVTVLVAVAWLAWLQFVLCVAVELRSAASGVGLPARVPLAGPSQRLARTLVSSVLLASTTVGTAAAAPTEEPGGSHEASAAVVTVAEQQEAVTSATGPAVGGGQVGAEIIPDGPTMYLLGDTVLDAEDAEQLVGRKVYRVQPPEGRYHDNLWDIAERHLGDGRRYKEIFELNRGRVQPDGHELSLARLIYPGWLLVMPEDAEGLDRVVAQTGQAPAATTPAPPSEPVDGSGDAGAAVAVSSGGAAWAEEASGAAMIGAVGGDGADEGSGTESRSTHGLEVLAGAGLLAAGLLAAIETARRRRRLPDPDDDGVEAEVALRIGADPDRAARLDGALRGLAASCQEQHRPLPATYAAVVDDAGVEVLLAPAAANAPEPWQVLDEGRRWRLDHADAARLRGDAAGPAPYPGLVSVGRDVEGRDVLIDLEAASGPIAVSGDPAAAYEVATALAAELATNRWSDRLRVTVAGLPGELTALDPQRLRLVSELEPVVAEVEAKRADRLGADVLTGRLRWTGAEAWVPEYVVLGSEPDAELGRQLLRLGGAGRSPLGVVCVGDFPGARWRLEVDSAGNLAVPALGLSVAGNRLSRPSVASVAALLAPHAPSTPDEIVRHEAWLPDVRPDVTPPAVAADTARLASAPVRIFVLGPAEVQAPGTIDDERRDLATEIVVHLALHREGVHPTVLGASVWPRGVTAEVRDAMVARVREWLGTSPEGSPHLLLTPDGKLRLSDDVAVDWEVVQTVLAQSREARSPAEEIDLLRRALRVARGPVLSERPQGRYSWIARVRLERVASDLLVDAAHRLSMLCFDGGDGGTAAAAARAGIRVRPGEQLLWRDLLRVEHERGGRDRVMDVAAELTSALGGLGVAELEPETMALLEELLPTEPDASSKTPHRV